MSYSPFHSLVNIVVKTDKHFNFEHLFHLYYRELMMQIAVLKAGTVTLKTEHDGKPEIL